MDRPKMECAGVPAGWKIFVGDFARAVQPNRNTQQAALRRGKAEMQAICLNGFVIGCHARIR
jgi:hypothetical protein